jgi:membrane-associated phospholipid phosphatase
MIVTPTHGSLPSGHATEVAIMAYVLWSLMRGAAPSTPPVGATGNPQYGGPEWGRQFMGLAERIAVNRQVAGVHFPVDSSAGALLGLTLGAYLVARFQSATATYQAWDFDGTQFPFRPDPASDFRIDLLFDTGSGQQISPGAWATAIGNQTIAESGQSAILHWLWSEARDEWT